MTTTVILFGTETGNAEMVAEVLAAELGETARIADMTDFDVTEFTPDDAYIVICSTQGDGELPSGAVPFYEALHAQRPDLAGIRFSVFGLGDSSYDLYNRGSGIIDERLRGLGAERVGDYGRHDADEGSLPNDGALEWLRAGHTSVGDQATR